MSLLTKLFVLLVAVLSLVLSGVTITLVTSANNYKVAYMSQKSAATAARSGMAETERNFKSAVTTRNAMVKLLQKDIEFLKAQMTEIQASNKRLLAEKNIAESKSVTATSLSASQSNTIEKMYVGQNELRDSLTQAHNDAMMAQAKSIDLARELSSEKVKYETVRSVYRQLEQDYVILEEENVKFRSQLQNVGVADSHFIDKSDQVDYQEVHAGRSAIEGQIIEVKSDYASISVGSASGVRENMQFIVYRYDGNEPSYLGDLTITRVEQSEAAGLLKIKNGMVLSGDSVTTKLSN